MLVISAIHVYGFRVRVSATHNGMTMMVRVFFTISASVRYLSNNGVHNGYRNVIKFLFPTFHYVMVKASPMLISGTMTNSFRVRF